MKYPKINTLWKRDVKTNKIICGDLSCPEFGNIKVFHVTEKINGTNIRIHYQRISGHSLIETLTFHGKTDDAQIPAHLLNRLQNKFDTQLFQSVWAIPTKEEKEQHIKDRKPTGEAIDVTLYGEGYGPNIHGGGGYCSCASFILFDVRIDGWWLEPNNVRDIAQKMEIACVPDLGIMTIEQIVPLVEKGFKSNIATVDKKLEAEGIVARSHPLMLFRNGIPIMWKLKHKDFKEGE